MNKIQVYKNESVPLKVATVLKVGELVYSSLGECFEVVDENKKEYHFRIVHNSVLNDGVFMEDLTNKQLEGLFWPLCRAELKKIGYEVENTSERS
ncbi:MAG: hypothetical protein GF383_15855 [Candidatus Lokiarchaeota archaeon]|nr:hypothetical protein [Candidatus Lokiarchaeota archaeon]